MLTKACSEDPTFELELALSGSGLGVGVVPRLLAVVVGRCGGSMDMMVAQSTGVFGKGASSTQISVRSVCGELFDITGGGGAPLLCDVGW